MANPVSNVLSRLVMVRGPVLTWYAADGQRVELSGPVLVQWVAKVSHLLTDLDLEPGDRVLVDLGADWRAPLVWLAAWHDGLTVTERPPAAVAVVREDRPAASPAVPAVPPDRLVVVPVAALATRVAQLPVGATDFAATARSFPDQAPPPADLDGPGLVTAADVAVDLSDLVAGGTGDRTLLGPAATPGQLVAVWAAGGSVVWHDGLDPTALARMVATETVTAGA